MIRFFYFLSLIMLFQIQVSAQNKTYTAESIPVEFPNSLQENFKDFQILAIDPEALIESIERGNSSDFFEWNLTDEYHFMIDVTEHQIRSEDYHLKVDGRSTPSVNTIKNYYGYLTGQEETFRLTVGGDYIAASIPIEDDALFIEPLNLFEKNAPSHHYVLYKRSDVQHREVKCGVNDIQQYAPVTPQANLHANECFIVELAVAADHLMFNQYGGTAGVIARSESIMNLVQGNYTSVFTNNVEYEIVEHVISTIPAEDPIPTSVTNSSTVIDNFRTWGNTPGNFISSYDLAQFLTYRDFDGSTVGVAYNDGGSGNGVVCTSSRYHIIQDNQVSLDAVRATTSHEIGHNWSAEHDGSNNAHIMTGTFNSGNPPSTWSAQSLNEISPAIQFTNDTRGCLGNCCDGSESPVASFTTSSTTICLSETISFVNNGEICVNSYNWSFPGGTPSSFSGRQPPAISYNSTGNFTVTLTVTNTNGSDMMTENINVVSVPPTADFIASTFALCGSGSISFSDMSSNCPDTYSWSFPGGTPSSHIGQTPPVVSYSGAGNYNVSLEVTNSNGSNTSTQTVQVLADATPGCSISGTPGNAGPVLVNFENISSASGTASEDATNPSFTKNGNQVVTFSCDQVANLETNTAYTFFFKPVPDVAQYLRIYIDYNGDGDFSDSGEFEIFTNYFTFQSNQTVNVTLTTNSNPTFNTNLRMRVIIDDGTRVTDPCSITGNGQAEDYGVAFLQALPVELSQFKGRIINQNNAELSWETQSESNNNYFTLEHSIDGRTFHAIATVDGQGDSETKHQYSYMDKNLEKGVHYYRLKQTDFDGTNQYAGETIALTVDAKTSIKIMPNPVSNGELSVYYNEEVSADIKFTIFDITGKLLIQKTAPSTGLEALDINELQSGMYLLKTEQGQESSVSRFIVK